MPGQLHLDVQVQATVLQPPVYLEQLRIAALSASRRVEAHALPQPFDPAATEPQAFLNQMATLQPRPRALHSDMALTSALPRERWS
tara:strand:- start:5310 stop:5567 length:258 start_codon:yes stop_codon:yes gene_type:complete